MDKDHARLDFSDRTVRYSGMAEAGDIISWPARTPMIADTLKNTRGIKGDQPGVRTDESGIARGWTSALQADWVSVFQVLKVFGRERRGNGAMPDIQTTSDLLWALIYSANDQGAKARLSAMAAMRRSNDLNHRQLADVLCRVSLCIEGDARAFNSICTTELPAAADYPTRLAALADQAMSAAVNFQQLRLPLAARLSRDSLAATQHCSHSAAFSSLPAVILAQIAYECGELAEADGLIRAILPRIKDHGMAETAVRSYITLARSAIRRGRCDFAATILREGDALGALRHWPRLSAACLAERVELLISMGKAEDAQAAFCALETLFKRSQCRPHPNCRIALHFELANYRMIARQQNPAKNVAVLRRLIADALDREDNLLAVELGIKLTAVLVRAGDEATAIETLAPLVEIGCNTGLFQTILDGDAEVKQMLSKIQPNLPAPYLKAYVTLLLDHWPATRTDDLVIKTEKRSAGILTPREWNVLQLMSQGNSNKRIAQQLGIAPETVKSHAKNIFQRLGSGTRAEAVSRAASLGVI